MRVGRVYPTDIRPVGEAFNPIESIKVGHVTLLISGIDNGAVHLSGEDDQSMLIKGTSVKVVEKSIITKINKDGSKHDDIAAVDMYIQTWTITYKELICRAKRCCAYLICSADNKTRNASTTCGSKCNPD
jgi:hypothetical protein